jgi:hypothetical protein
VEKTDRSICECREAQDPQDRFLDDTKVCLKGEGALDRVRHEARKPSMPNRNRCFHTESQNQNEEIKMKKLLIVFALLFAMPAFADDLDQYIQLLKTDLKANARDYVKKGMVTFTDEEAKRFWPIYDSYMTERGKFFDARLALIMDYADNFDKMTDAKAQEMLNRRVEQLKLKNQLDEKYRAQFATALSPRRLVRFYQIQQELEVMIELRAISEVPRMKWWQGE